MNLENIKSVMPSSVFEVFEPAITKFNINTTLRISHFLAQIMQESGNFTATSENLNYSAKRLVQVFPKYFPGNLSELYERNPIKIASRIYGNRLGNGNEASRDGYEFRGRGYIQLTGKNNYISFGNAINEDLTKNPDLVATPKYAMLSAAWFWNSNKLNEIADTGSTIDVIRQITKKVNGGYLGLDGRIKYFNNIYKLLS